MYLKRRMIASAPYGVPTSTAKHAKAMDALDDSTMVIAPSHPHALAAPAGCEVPAAAAHEPSNA